MLPDNPVHQPGDVLQQGLDAAFLRRLFVDTRRAVAEAGLLHERRRRDTEWEAQAADQPFVVGVGQQLGLGLMIHRAVRHEGGGGAALDRAGHHLIPFGLEHRHVVGRPALGGFEITLAQIAVRPVTELRAQAGNGLLDEVDCLFDAAVAVDLVHPVGLGEVDQLVGRIVLGRQAFEHLLVRRFRRQRPAAQFVQQRLDVRPVQQLARIDATAAGRPHVDRHRIDDHQLVEQRRDPLAPIVLLVRLEEEVGQDGNERVVFGSRCHLASGLDRPLDAGDEVLLALQQHRHDRVGRQLLQLGEIDRFGPAWAEVDVRRDRKVEAAAANGFRGLRRQRLPGPEPAVGHLSGERELRRGHDASDDALVHGASGS